MDYKTLVDSVERMNDEQLYLAAKKIDGERRRRHAQAQVVSSAAPGSGKSVIDLGPLMNGVRESLRIEMSAWSEPALMAVMDQVAEFPAKYSEVAVLNDALHFGLTVAYVHEARCEIARRVPG